MRTPRRNKQNENLFRLKEHGVSLASGRVGEAAIQVLSGQALKLGNREVNEKGERQRTCRAKSNAEEMGAAHTEKI